MSSTTKVMLWWTLTRATEGNGCKSSKAIPMVNTAFFWTPSNGKPVEKHTTTISIQSVFRTPWRGTSPCCRLPQLWKPCSLLFTWWSWSSIGTKDSDNRRLWNGNGRDNVNADGTAKNQNGYDLWQNTAYDWVEDESAGTGWAWRKRLSLQRRLILPFAHLLTFTNSPVLETWIRPKCQLQCGGKKCNVWIGWSPIHC